jgi:DNA-binding transcriptional LysR family regulator
MTLNQLEQFLAVTRLMNISRAAEELYVSHSSISRNISLLEDELNTVLINRDNKVSSLTKAGALLAERAEYIIQYIEDTKRDVRSVGTRASTNLKVISNGFEDPRILELFSDFRRLRPDTRVTAEYSSDLDSLKKLVEKKTDVAFCFSFALPEDLDPNIGTMKLYDDEFVALVSSQSPMSELSVLDVKKPTYDRPVCISNAQCDFVSSIAVLDSMADSDQAAADCNSMEQLLMQIKYSGHWAIVPRYIALRNQTGCKLLPLVNTDSRYSVMMCWNRQNPNPLIHPFLEAVKSAFAGETFDQAEELAQ